MENFVTFFFQMFWTWIRHLTYNWIIIINCRWYVFVIVILCYKSMLKSKATTNQMFNWDYNSSNSTRIINAKLFHQNKFYEFYRNSSQFIKKLSNSNQLFCLCFNEIILHYTFHTVVDCRFYGQNNIQQITLTYNFLNRSNHNVQFIECQL